MLIAERCCEAAPRDILLRSPGAHHSQPPARAAGIGCGMKQWTADHTRRLLAMKREGLSTTTIALRLGCSRTTVRKKLQEIERQTKQDNR